MAQAAVKARAATADYLDQGELLQALRAYRKGDFSVRLPMRLSGIDGEIAQAFNDVVEMNQDLMKEFDRLSNAVGKQGKINQRGKLDGAKGGWQAKVDAVNSLIGDIAQPTEEVARVIGAVAKGDLSQTMRLDIEGRPLRGEFLRIGKSVNTMVGHLSAFSAEVTRVAREVGTEGKLGGQARVKGAAGTWKDLTDNVNMMASNLTNQVRNIADVTTAVARGDLSKKITVDVKGEILELKDTINTMVDQLGSFSAEVTRVAREVGTEGKLGGQARVEGVGGVWKDLTDNVNLMATNLTSQVRNIAEVTTAVARGDLSQTMMVEIDGRPLRGEFLGIAQVVNTMVGQLSSFAAEVTRVAREVGTEGKLGGQAKVEGVAGTWKDLTDNVNMMADNLTNQVRNIAEVTTAVARGDLSKQITVDVKGEILELKNTINTMVDQLGSFAAEVTRVAREVGTEGKLGGQAQVEGVAGTWKDLTDNVNAMANNLTSQVRNIAEVTTAVARGDLSKQITVDVRGEIREVKDTINTMVDQLSSFAAEVTRVAREVGTEGKLGGQAKVEGVAGTWKDLTDNVNAMANNLTSQVRNIAEVTTAVARGDLSKKITVDVKGEIREVKDTINTMVDQLSSFAAEVTRVAREVGTEGKLGGQAKVEGVAGTWKDLTDNVNLMANNLTSQVRNIAEVTTAVARGDLSKQITVDVKGEILELKNTINTMVDQLSSFAAEVTRVAREVGTEGKLGGQAKVEGVAGTWKDLTDNVNLMANNLTSQVRNIAEVTTAVARGDLSKQITVDVKGEILELKNTINTMVDQLSSFAAEVTRVAREVGTEGKLGGQAKVEGVAGTWKDLTDNVNMMADNLTNQVRGIANVVTAVAQGDLTRKLTVDAKGEIAALADTINGMIDTLATFGDQVTNVAHEVGIEGKLGGQAKVPGAAGLWRNLTNNVNQLAANLTAQVRAIAEVATAVTKGDLTRSITVEASGEVAALKDNVNAMIRTLEETTQKNMEQDWLKTNLARFSRMLQGERDVVTVSNLILSELTPLVNAQHGAFYVTRASETGEEDAAHLELMASYAFSERKSLSNRYMLREGLIGQCAYEKKRILLHNLPEDYVQIKSGLGQTKPVNIVVLPILFEGEVEAVLEIASTNRFSDTHLSFLDQLMESIGIMLNTISANMRTEGLLTESQRLTAELQSQQEELKKTNDRLEQQAASLKQSEELLRHQQDELRHKNEELEDKARLLAQEKVQVETINLEVEKAKKAVEEKAEQLALTSKYKSEFLANMSHELRTPLNNMLILSNLLTENVEGGLSDKQVEFARTIHAAGNDLLSLINDILDLSKIESGTITLNLERVPIVDLRDDIRRTFEHMASDQGLKFTTEFDNGLPVEIYTDKKRLEQLLLNLLSNAFKFTDEGEVAVSVYLAESGWLPDNRRLAAADQVVAFSVTDTGVGIAPEDTKHIFEAFHQVDGSTNRKYGGTGLGLSICREISDLLGGEIAVESELGKGSTFTLYLPLDHGNPVRKTLVEHRPAESAYRMPALQTLVAVDSFGQEASLLEPAVLIASDDPTAARELAEFAARAGMKSVQATADDDLVMVARTSSVSAVVLRFASGKLAGTARLDYLKHNAKTCHIPVHVIAEESERNHAMRAGAGGFTVDQGDAAALSQIFIRLKTLVEQDESRLLIVQRSASLDAGLAAHIPSGDGIVTTLVKPSAALAVFRDGDFTGVLVDSSAFGQKSRGQLLELYEEAFGREVPALIYGPAVRSGNNGHSRTMLPRCFATTTALLAEAAKAFKFPAGLLPPETLEWQQTTERPDPVLAGRRIAIIDDDIRNIFSLTAVLEQHEMEVVQAEDGRSGLELIERTEPDVVLVDIMMPELDGYETIKRIRSNGRMASLPVLAVTAKAMKGDRELCLEAGATDYISKPINIPRLLATLRVWLRGVEEKAAVEQICDTQAPVERLH